MAIQRPNGVPWLSNEDYVKAVGQLRLHVTNLMSPFDTMGMGDFIGGTVDQIVKAAEDFGLRVRGVEKVIGDKEVLMHVIGQKGEDAPRG